LDCLKEITIMRKWILKLAMTAMLVFGVSAFADTVGWTNWTSQPSATQALGTLTFGSQTVNVMYSGEIGFTQLNNGGTYYYNPAATYTSTTVSNAPPTADMIAINGTATTHTITFSSAVTDPVMAIVSMGQSGVATTYTFDAPFTILSQGPGIPFGGCNTCLSISGNSLVGNEGDGVIQFNGTFTSISWTGANPEFWNGFTFGAAGVAGGTGVPEPSTLLLLFAGSAGLLGTRRKLQ
jgi:hypothetical protein